MRRGTFMALAATLIIGSALPAADWGLEKGTPVLQSAGPLAFGPDGILAVGDIKAAVLFAIDTDDRTGDVGATQHNIEGLGEKVANTLGVNPAQLTINDLAVNPTSGNLYLSAHAEETPAIVRVTADGKLEKLSLEDVLFSQIALPDPPADEEVGQGNRRRNLRLESITDIAYTEGKLLVAGLSGSAWPATIREIPFPFSTADQGVSIEIYHGAHGKLEDNATPRVFVPFNIDGQPSLLAGFTCTPLVKFPVEELKSGEKVRGTTIAELGNRNKPLDMIVYEKDGADWLLIANSNRGVMKVSTADIARTEGITEPVPGGETAGQPYETIEDWKGVVQLDKLNDTQAVVLVQDGEAFHLKTVDLP